ncbi:unnamed protein product, partial [Staurois parvus]
MSCQSAPGYLFINSTVLPYQCSLPVPISAAYPC